MSEFTQARVAMVDCQVRPSDVTRYPIIEAMLAIPREDFVPAAMRQVAYADAEIALAEDRVVMEPRTFAKMCDALAVRGDELVLYIGAGLGYGPAVVGWVAEAVVAVEDDADRAAEAARILSDAEAINVIVEEAALTVGAPDHGPYDAIFVEGAIETLPETLAAQLKVGGRITAVFLKDGQSQAKIGVKTSAGIGWRRAFDATAPVLPGFAVEKSFEF